MSDADFVTAFAPASIGNVGVGYDILGLAIAGTGDRVAARRTDGGGITIREVRVPMAKFTLTCPSILITTRHQSLPKRYGMRRATHQASS